MKYIIANWKAHKNLRTTEQWLDDFISYNFAKIKHKTQIIICPPFPFIPLVKERLSHLDFVKIGAQDISSFHGGSYTGEVTIDNLTGLVDYVIIGHSERRRYFSETDAIIFQKYALAEKNHIQPIFCLRDMDDMIAPKARFVAYEPDTAIGTGKNEPLEKITRLKKQLNLNKDTIFIYGGSVDKENASDYLNFDAISGLLVGSASLNAHEFFAILTSVEKNNHQASL